MLIGAFINAIDSNIPPLILVALVAITAATSDSCEKSGTSINAGSSENFRNISLISSSPVLFIVLVLYPPIVLIETDCKIDISISNFKFLYICLTTFSFFQLSGIIYKTQFTIGVEIDEHYKI